MNDILKTESAYTGKNVNIVFFRLQTQRNKYFKMSYSSAAKYIPYMSISEFSFDKTQLYRQQLQECLNVKQFLEKSIESKPVFYDGIYNSLKGE